MKKNFYVVITILFMFTYCSKQAIGQISDEKKVRALIPKAEDAWNAKINENAAASNPIQDN